MSISDIENRAYQWLGKDGGWQVGRPLLIDGEIYCRLGSIAMQPRPTGEAVWVRLDEIQPYPAEPIEEPSAKGGER